MTKDRKILYAVSFILTAALLGLLFVKGDSGRYIAAVFLFLATVVCFAAIKKQSVYSIHYKQVTLLLIVAALLTITVFYLSGLYFGFRKATVPFSLHALYRCILPLSAIVIFSELIRARLLAQQRLPVTVCAWLIGVCAELLCSSALTAIIDVYRLMDLVGMTLFPAMVSNVLYHHTSVRYGPYATLAYRLPMALYPYLLPYAPTPPDAILSFAKMVIPLALLGFLAALYGKKPRRAREKRGKWRFIVPGVAALVCVLFVMLISCRFAVGAMVIGSESMTGALNVGDAIVYQQYKDQTVQVGDIIIFTRYNQRVIHRVVEIACINGETRYYTKGDANDNYDTGYVTDSEIIGVTDFKIAYIGYPTVWLHRLFAVRS